MSEKTFENKVKKMLKQKGIWHFKVWGSMFQAAGVPDILGCCNGRLIALEIKDVNGKASKLQIYVIEQIQACGGYARFVYPSDYEDLIKDLTKIERMEATKFNL